MKKFLAAIVVVLILMLGGCDWFTPTPTTTANTVETTIASTNQTTQQTTVATTTPTTVGTTAATTTATSTTMIDEILLVLMTGQDTVEINGEWIDTGAKLIVNNLEEFLMVTTNTINTTAIGLNTIIYTYEYNSEIYTITRYVMVVDQTAPELTLNLGVDTIVVGNNWIDGGVTTIDNSLGNVTVIVTGTVDTNTPGVYEITYTATDSSSNISSIIRYVTVIN